MNLADARGLDGPAAVAIDESVTPNRLYVADTQNNRVLGWNDAAALSDGQPADLVIGQPDFFSCPPNNGGIGANTLFLPGGVATDASGNVYVADTGNNRVLEFDQPFAQGTTAKVVFGQAGSFTSSVCNLGEVSAQSLCGPQGVALDAGGNLYVADAGNNRMLEYNTPLQSTSTPGSGDTTADLVFGTSGSFTCTHCGGGVNADTLSAPGGVVVDSVGNVFAADSGNNRVLEYFTPLTITSVVGSGDTTADAVLGQSNANFTSSICYSGGTNPPSQGLCNPTGVALDLSANVYVADANNGRVAVYNTPFVGNPGAPSLAIGRSGCANPGGGNFCNPAGVALDASGALYISDTGNNRVLKYNTPLQGEASADLELGQIDLSHKEPNFPDASSLDLAAGTFDQVGVAIDKSVTPNHLYVVDAANNRVLGWRNAPGFANGQPADLVIGQPDFFSSGSCGSIASVESLCHPAGIAVDASGHLYLADSGNSRVVEYDNPFNSGTQPNLVINGSGLGCGIGINRLCEPEGVAVDAAGDLYVADSGNNRVLEYNTPLQATATPGSGDTIPDIVFGQMGSFTTNNCNFSLKPPAGPPTPDSLCLPVSVAVDPANNLYVADTLNNRVLEYDNPLAPGGGNPGTPGSAGDTTADTVFGQLGSFTTASECNAEAVSAVSLCDPLSVATDSTGNLYVGDAMNNRVLEYNTPLAVTGVPGSGDATADLVFGQFGVFTSALINNGGLSADSLWVPAGVTIDASCDLYVADEANNRVLEYDRPLGSQCLTPPATPTPGGINTVTPSPSPTPTPMLSATATETPSGSQTATPTPSPVPSPGGRISLSATSISFRAVGVDARPAVGSIEIRNLGRQSLVVNVDSEFVAPPFSFAGPGSFTLSPHHKQTITFEFTPTSPGGFAGALDVVSSDPIRPVVGISLSGTGVPGQIDAPGAINFGTLAAGRTKKVHFRIKNVNLGVLHGHFDTTNLSATPFAITSGGEPFALSRGEARTVEAEFSPMAPSSGHSEKEVGTLTIISDDPKNPHFNVLFRGVAR